MKERRFFLKQLTKAEVGDTKTHEKYIRFPNDFDYEQFFSEQAKPNGTVLQIDINAQYDWNSEVNIPLKFVFYANSNKEKRMPSLGTLFDSYNVVADDIFCLEAICSDSDVKYSISFKKPDEISLLTSPICYINRLDVENTSSIKSTSKQTLQQIYFGAPGTGKSFAIDGVVNKDNSVRTTFHPDSDYSTFVGCYKPVKKIAKSTQKTLLDYNGLVEKFKEYLEVKPTNITKACTLFGYDYHDSIVKMQEDNSHTIPELVAESYKEGSTYDSVLRAGMSVYETSSSHTNNEASEITYEFVPQAFTTAYVNAWKDRSNPYYLIIEEINRGNCAQIFGDIFQLLDRDSSGMSSYKITPDKDLQGYLASELKDCDIDEDIKSGEKMQLPSNLNILATMNTSDQSLFPIDSAFKRRWDWKYIPIDYTDKGHYIACGSVKYKWTEFLEAVNARIESVTQSEDKKMGGWFVKPNGKEITADKFVSKVVFYLWNDVFKDFGHDGNTIFKDDFNKFHKFFDFKGDVKLDVLEKFLVALGLTPLKNTADLTDEDDFEADYDESIAPNQKGYDYSMYSINGDGRYNKGEVAHEAVKMFINNHSNLSANEVVEIWSNLGITVTNLIMSEETYNDKKNKSKEPKSRFERRYNEIKINEDARIYVTKGFTLESITQFIEKVNSQLDWNINIEQI